MTDEEIAVWGVHFERFQRALADGTLVLVGPTLGSTNTGIAIFEAPDEAAARRFMEEDPVIAGGFATGELRPFRVASCAARLTCRAAARRPAIVGAWRRRLFAPAADHRVRPRGPDECQQRAAAIVAEGQRGDPTRGWSASRSPTTGAATRPSSTTAPGRR